MIANKSAEPAREGPCREVNVPNHVQRETVECKDDQEKREVDY